MISKNYNTFRMLRNVSDVKHFQNPHEVIQRELLKSGYFICRDRGLRIISLRIKAASW